VEEGVLERCVMRGCTVVGGLDRDGRGSNAGGFFLGQPPPTPTNQVTPVPDALDGDIRTPTTVSRRRDDPKELSLTYDLTTLPPLTIPFYTNLLLHLQHDGCFDLPLSPRPPPPLANLTSVSPTPTPTEGALLILVPREKEKDWIERGLVALTESERERVRIEVVAAGEAGWWDGGEGASGRAGGTESGIRGGAGRDGRGGWGW
jgi:hypothetical protein